MILKSNKIHKNSPKRKSGTLVSKVLRSGKPVLTGTFILNVGAFAFLKTVIFIGILLIIYISNSYWVEHKINQKAALEQTLVELRFRQIALRNEVVRLQKFSVLQDRLADKGLKQWLEPPYHIKSTKVKTTPNQNNYGN